MTVYNLSGKQSFNHQVIIKFYMKHFSCFSPNTNKLWHEIRHANYEYQNISLAVALGFLIWPWKIMLFGFSVLPWSMKLWWPVFHSWLKYQQQRVFCEWLHVTGWRLETIRSPSNRITFSHWSNRATTQRSSGKTYLVLIVLIKRNSIYNLTACDSVIFLIVLQTFMNY